MRLCEQVTVLVYTFPKAGAEDAAFTKIAAAVEQTWRHVGRLKTVIVASHRFAAVEKFAAGNKEVELQIEPTLVPGNIKTMSMDCIKRLYRRFSTSYVLIIQDDGFPIRGGVEEFIGRWDYVGAPFVRDKPWQFIADWMLINVENGGFCMRSRRVCEATARLYEKMKSRLSSKQISLEDQFYCRYARTNLWHRLRYSFAPASKAREFSFIDVEGLIDVKTLKKTPLGIHSPTTIWQFRDYLSREFGYVDVPVKVTP